MTGATTRRLSPIVCAAVILTAGAPATAREKRVEVTVVEIAGGRAYLKPGEEAGLRPGVIVELAGKSFTVLSVTADNAVVEIAGARVEVGDRGRATVDTVAAQAAERLPEPSPLSRFAGQWRDPKPPALGAKAPRAVPLGRMAATESLRTVLVGHVAATTPHGALSASMGGEVHFQPWRDVPLGFDADAALLLWAGGVERLGGASRPLVRVRELRLRYGGERRPWAALGRLRWAAEGVGLLDGVRVAAPVGRGLSLAAFGGYVPDPVDGRPTFDIARFGAEAGWSPAGPWHPRLDVAAYGSVWQGALDERRAIASVRLFPRDALLAAYAELSGFDADNPWGAATVELTAAGAEGSWRRGPFRAEARLDARQPERSRFLASLLPQSWLCTASPRPPGTPEPCDGGRDVRVLASASAGVTLFGVALDAGGAAIGTDAAPSESWSSFAAARFPLPWRARGELGATTTKSPFLTDAAVRVGAGVPLVRLGADVAAWYRGGWLDYRASTERWIEHRAGIDVTWSGEPDLDVTVSVEGTTGRDLEALAVIATAVWRPSP